MINLDSKRSAWSDKHDKNEDPIDQFVSRMELSREEYIELKSFVQTSDYSEFKTLHECSDMLIKGMKNTGKDCLILFTGASHRLGRGIKINDDWLDKIGIKHSSVFLVSDLKKSWSNCINIEILKNTFHNMTIYYNSSFYYNSSLQLGARHNLISPSEATVYLITNG